MTSRSQTGGPGYTSKGDAQADAEYSQKIARDIFVTPDQAKRMIEILERDGWKSPEEVRRGKEMVREAFRFPK